MKIVLDIETTFQREGKKSNPSPYDPRNRLVSVGWINVDTGHQEYLMFDHKDSSAKIQEMSSLKLQAVLSNAELIIGHNHKFDMAWLFECGFTYEGPYWDTMIYEYVVAKGLKPELSLAVCAKKYGLPEKLDWFKEQMEAGLNTDEMDWAGLL